MVTGHDKYAKYALSDSEWALLEWLWALLHHLNVCSKYVGVTKLPSISFMIPCFGKMIDLFENEPEPYLETQEERQLWRDATKDAVDKLKKYYSHTVQNPYYTFGLSKLFFSL